MGPRAAPSRASRCECPMRHPPGRPLLSSVPVVALARRHGARARVRLRRGRESLAAWTCDRLDASKSRPRPPGNLTPTAGQRVTPQERGCQRGEPPLRRVGGTSTHPRAQTGRPATRPAGGVVPKRDQGVYRALSAPRRTQSCDGPQEQGPDRHVGREDLAPAALGDSRQRVHAPRLLAGDGCGRRRRPGRHQGRGGGGRGPTLRGLGSDRGL